MVMPNLSVSAGGGGPSGSSSNAGVMVPIDTPFNFDHSGWVVNFGNGNNTDAAGNKDANASTQTPAGAGGGLAALTSNPMLLLGIAAAVLLMRRR